MSWTVKEGKNVGYELKRAFHTKEISLEDIELIRVWVRQVEGFGPESLRKTWNLKEATQLLDETALNRKGSDINFWNDHELIGEWTGHRSSSFSQMGRIIYKIENEEIKIVKIVKITGTHSY
jgi:mRNA-degrading endonuclease YafQ of YafQ-DinJ toxin-antitoxin module